MDSAITPPSLYPVHHPTTAIAAPAAIDLLSLGLICSILKASTVMSCVAEAIAIINPMLIKSVKFSVGLIKLQIIKLSNIISCIKTIQPRLCPNLLFKKGI